MTDSSTNRTKWNESDRAAWLAKQKIQRSYLNDVVSRLKPLSGQFIIEQYGVLSYAPDKYPLFIVKSKNWHKDLPNILVTGGVHGYETSGVHGALRFLEQVATRYSEQFNLVVVPCVSPWGYETINRWNPNAVDPNRSFYDDSPAEEAAKLMQAVASLELKFLAHFDLHETTDTDNTIFMPDLAARDGTELIIWEIPDGFYTVGDSENPQEAFQKAIIESVKQVTHIAPADNSGNIIGEPITQEGVINYPKKKLGLCASFSNAEYCTTTEVYPDSPSATPEDCIQAQVAAVTGGLDYLVQKV